MFDSEKWETPYRGREVLLLKGLAKEEGKRGTKEISRCARNDSVGGNGYPDDSVENGYPDDRVGNEYQRYRITCALVKCSFLEPPI